MTQRSHHSCQFTLARQRHNCRDRLDAGVVRFYEQCVLAALSWVYDAQRRAAIVGYVQFDPPLGVPIEVFQRGTFFGPDGQVFSGRVEP